MKIFDCQNGMPQDVKDVFYELNCDTGNDSYVSHQVIDVTNDEHTILDVWLLECGAAVDEYVLIHHWW